MAAEHPERIAEYNARRREVMRVRRRPMTPEAREYHRAWREKNRERIAAQKRIYVQQHMDDFRRRSLIRRARRFGNGHTPYRPAEIYERDSWTCGICGQPVDKMLRHPDPMSRSIDHIVALNEGGPDTPENVRLAHLRCNLARPDRWRGAKGRWARRPRAA